MKSKFVEKYLKYSEAVALFVKDFGVSGNLISEGRNKIKLFQLEDAVVNIKSFKSPNLINKIVYKYIRKSKARRSFEYANRLLENGIGTPQPIAYFENHDAIGLKDSYYVSEHLNCDFTFRDLVEKTEVDDHENILRQFTRFSFLLHQKGIEFKDHSPGNTLIKKRPDGNYDFFLVDLNRMEFHNEMPFAMRMKNLCRLTPHKDMVRVMSSEYAILSNESESLVFSVLWKFTEDFQYRFHRKKRMKKKLKFWK